MKGSNQRQETNRVRMNSLVNESSHERPAISIILVSHQLMSVPSEINIKSWNKERSRRRGHEVKETVNGIEIYSKTT